jgi:predicted HicB family RNase H-like nuclease
MLIVLKQAFIDSIEDYLEFCAEQNESPEKPFSGKFNLRISLELHREAFIAAKKTGMRLNAWVCDILKHAT